MRCATRCAASSSATTCCCRPPCRSRRVDAGRNVPPTLPDRTIVTWVYYTYPFNLTGQPAASVCAGFGADGMPVGLQIVGRTSGEADVMRVAAAFEGGAGAGI